MSFEGYTGTSTEEIFSEFKQNKETGYLQNQVKNLQIKHGKNTIISKQTTWLHILLRQVKSAFIYILIIAALITFTLGEYIDGIFILTFVLINVLLGFFQEYKSEQTIKFLKQYTNKRATVIRDAQEITIDATELIPGDIVIIETGDIVPADIRLFETNALVIDESTLTGEAVQVIKHENINQKTSDISQATNIAFSGTVVTEGMGKGIVIAIGTQTQLGKIAKLTTEIEETSAFEKQVNKFSKFILVLTLITITLVFIVHIFFKNTLSILDLTIYSIALAIGVIPEAMPLVTTFSLSLGAQNLAKKKVVVKRLSAIEDLGGIQILCTDKTGTITENKLSIADIYAKDKDQTLLYGLLAASSFELKETPNNSFDLAIFNQLADKTEVILQKAKRINEIPFNPTRRRNSVLISYDNKQLLITRGAAESIMPHIKNITELENQQLIEWILSEGKKGRRIIAVAYKDFAGDTYNIADEETNVLLSGLMSFEDPIKASTEEAIAKAKELGIVTKIITGDSAEVAAAVGHKVGIAASIKDVVTGDEFLKLPIEQQKETAKNINVYARMSPEQKHYLVKLLQEDFEVGFLGEGINDGPALKAAGVSLVVDHASDVSREVADIILLKHDLKVIIDGIEQGRRTFINVTNYVKATLASNFGNFYAMAFVTLIIDYLPMLPIQILLVNLLSDFPMIAIATDSVDKKSILNPKNYAFSEIILLATILGIVSTAFDFMMFGIFKHLGESSLQTYWFMGSILTELVLIYSIRTRDWVFKTKTMPSLAIILLTITASVFTVVIPFTEFGDKVFSFVTPSIDKLLLVFGITIGYLISTDIMKKIYYRYTNSVS